MFPRPEIIQYKFFQFSYSKFRHSNHRIGAHTCTNHTVPYGTALWGGAVPGTSCQATIAPSLRDISQQALARLSEARPRERSANEAARQTQTMGASSSAARLNSRPSSALNGQSPRIGLLSAFPRLLLVHAICEPNCELGASPLYQGTVDFFTKYL